MITRRDFQIGIGVSALLLSNGASFAQDETIEIEGELPPLPDDLVTFENSPAVSDYGTNAVVGVQRPTNEEVVAASQLLFASPIDATPIGVAQYLLDVGSGKYGEQNRKFAREWPVRANPLIHHFFTSTRTFPEGDVTPWCAAFANWCIARSQVKDSAMIGTSPDYYVTAGTPFSPEILALTSRSAASGSFRCFPDTSTPELGDLVVWRKPGTENQSRFCAGQGHVAFFLSEDGGKIRVLGGNQREGGSNGAVTIAKWPRNLRTHAFHGFRSWKKV